MGLALTYTFPVQSFGAVFAEEKGGAQEIFCGGGVQPSSSRVRNRFRKERRQAADISVEIRFGGSKAD